MADNSEAVILDANIWIGHRLFRSSLGAAFLYALKTTNIKICLPDITELELINGVVSEGTKAVQRVESGYLTIQALLGSRPDYQSPTPEDFKSKATERITELGNLIQRIEISISHYKAALNRVIEGVPPNRTKEQFRDSLLWEVVRELSSSHEVAFITKDYAFYEENKPERGPASELLEEVKLLQRPITFHTGLESYLKAVEEKIPPVDYDYIAQAINSALHGKIIQYALERQITLGPLKKYGMEAYLTEDQDKLAVAFELSYSATDLGQLHEEGSGTALVVVVGNGSYNLSLKLPMDLQLGKIECKDAEGKMTQGKSISYIYAGDVLIGTRLIPFSVRRKLTHAPDLDYA